jgi:predicted PurR-regulated permease PerM
MKILLSNKNFGKIFVLGILFFLTATLFFSYIVILGLAAIFAFALDPYIQKMRDSGIRNRSVGAGIIVAILLLTVTGPILFAFYQLYIKVVELNLVGNPQAMKDKALALSEKLNSQISILANHVGLQGDVSGAVSDLLNRGAEMLISGGTYLVIQLPEILFMIFIFSLGTYYFLSQSRKLHHFMEESGIFSRHEVFHLINALRVASRTAVISSVITGFAQALIVATGAQIAGFNMFSTIFVVTFFVSFIPVIGAAPVALAMMVPAIADGDKQGALILLGTAMIAGVADNILRPYVIGGAEDDIHPILTLLAIFGGITVFGLPGLFLGPVIISTAYKIIPLFVSRIKKGEHESVEDLTTPLETPPESLYQPVHFQ